MRSSTILGHAELQEVWQADWNTPALTFYSKIRLKCKTGAASHYAIEAWQSLLIEDHPQRLSIAPLNLVPGTEHLGENQ
jgi:hypothetical protein